MQTPSVPFAVWLLAAFDPVLIAVAVTLGWKASQFGTVFIAVRPTRALVLYRFGTAGAKRWRAS